MLAQDYFKHKKFDYVSPDINKNFSKMEVDVNMKANFKVEVLREDNNDQELVEKYKPEITLQEVVSFIENCNEIGWYLFLVRDKNDNLVWLYARRLAGGEWTGYVRQLDDGFGWFAGYRLVLRNQPLDTSDLKTLSLPCPHCGEIIKFSK